MLYSWSNNCFQRIHNCFREPSVSHCFSQLRLDSSLSRQQRNRIRDSCLPSATLSNFRSPSTRRSIEGVVECFPTDFRVAVGADVA